MVRNSLSGRNPAHPGIVSRFLPLVFFSLWNLEAIDIFSKQKKRICPPWLPIRIPKLTDDLGYRKLEIGNVRGRENDLEEENMDEIMFPRSFPSSYIRFIVSVSRE